MSNVNFSFEQQMVKDWTTSVRIEPIGIIFVKGFEQVEDMAMYCRKLLKKTDMEIVQVFCLNSAFEIDELINVNNIDILVMSVFCFETLVNHMPKLFTSDRLRYIWFDQIDEMCDINCSIICNTTNIIFAQGLDIQVNIEAAIDFLHEFESCLFKEIIFGV